MADRDLTPAEAKAEIEAFMGEGWIVWAGVHDTPDDCPEILYVAAHDSAGLTSLWSMAPSFRASVSELKQAWRDAVRPWVCVAIQRGYEAGDADIPPSKSAVVARVLKEDSSNG